MDVLVGVRCVEWQATLARFGEKLRGEVTVVLAWLLHNWGPAELNHLPVLLLMLSLHTAPLINFTLNLPPSMASLAHPTCGLSRRQCGR